MIEEAMADELQVLAWAAKTVSYSVGQLHALVARNQSKCLRGRSSAARLAHSYK